jgi:hypothetical protein
MINISFRFIWLGFAFVWLGLICADFLWFTSVCHVPFSTIIPFCQAYIWMTELINDSSRLSFDLISSDWMDWLLIGKSTGVCPCVCGSVCMCMWISICWYASMCVCG